MVRPASRPNRTDHRNLNEHGSDRASVTIAADPVANPETAFETPAAVAIDRDLSLDEKLAALSNWEHTVRRRLAAAQDQGGAEGAELVVRDADILDRISRARSAISEPQGKRFWRRRDNAARKQRRTDAVRLTTEEARQGSRRMMNFRILENSLFLAALAAVALFAWVQFA